MEKLRHDINTVFNRQQSGLGYTAGVSERLLRQALAPTPGQPRFAPQLAAAIATLLLGAALAYVVVVTHGHLKSQSPVTRVTPSVRPSVSARAIPVPTPLARPLVIPSTTPAILYFDPVDPQQVDGVTWDGSQRGRMGALGTASSLYQNPSGTLYSTFRDIYDRSGRVVASMNLGNNKAFTWADDGQHYCQIVSRSALPPAGGEPGTLRVVTTNGSVLNVAQVGVMGDQFGSSVAACSLSADRAVVIQTASIGATTHYWVVQISTGRILWSRSLANSPTYVSASRDGQLIAEPGSIGGSDSTTIYGPNGAVAGHVQGVVQGFSWDGRLVAVAQYGARPSVVEWRTGKVVWTAPAGTMYSNSRSEPGGARILIEVQTPGHPQTGGYPIVDVYAVSPDGTAVQILANVSA